MSTALVSTRVSVASPQRPLDQALRVVRALARRFEAWREASRRAATDRDLLVCMSDRELLDIGISRASIASVAERGWKRDYPH